MNWTNLTCGGWVQSQTNQMGTGSWTYLSSSGPTTGAYLIVTPRQNNRVIGLQILQIEYRIIKIFRRLRCAH